MVNAIIDELKRPINIHRWRVLEAIDPDAYNLVKKINIVTQRLVDHNEHIRLQNLRIADKEHIYVDIRGVTKHLPGQETREERLYYDVLYKSKQRQLDNLKHEMYANEAQTAYFRGQVSILSKKMAALKKAYFDKMSKKNKKKAIGSNNKTSLLAITSSALPQPSERSSTTETYNDRQEGPNDQLIS
ncbi:cilia- and flagella-associated protein 58 [Folsomia candida]|nr:cilia- and flagella-associated protein 58 [Folsomia candida]